MKTLIKLFFSVTFILTLGMNGCYTIVWTPDTPMPEQQNSEDSFYNNPYYGDYYYYYDSPWWYTAFPNSYYGDNNQNGNVKYRENNQDLTKLRNDNGRGSGTTRLPDIPRTETVTPVNNSSGSSNSQRETTSGTRNTSGSSNNSRGSTSNSGNRNSNNDRNSNGRN